MSSSPYPLKIIGLDPGLQITGWGLISIEGNRLKYLGHGVIKTNSSSPLPQRLSHLYQNIKDLMEMHLPHEAAVEETFVNKNAASALKLGMARGVVLCTPAIYGVPVGEYSANKVKKTVVGVGHAEKHQVSMMVQRLLSGCEKVTADAADALAVAICHAHYRSVSSSS